MRQQGHTVGGASARHRCGGLTQNGTPRPQPKQPPSPLLLPPPAPPPHSCCCAWRVAAGPYDHPERGGGPVPHATPGAAAAHGRGPRGRALGGPQACVGGGSGNWLAWRRRRRRLPASPGAPSREGNGAGLAPGRPARFCLRARIGVDSKRAGLDVSSASSAVAALFQVEMNKHIDSIWQHAKAWHACCTAGSCVSVDILRLYCLARIDQVWLVAVVANRAPGPFHQG